MLRSHFEFLEGMFLSTKAVVCMKMHLGPWTYFHTLYIILIIADIFCICGIYCTSVCARQRDPSSVVPFQVSPFA